MLFSRATTAIFVVGLLAFGSAFHTVVPQNKELIYQYHALMNVGTHDPVHYASQFHLHGYLHVQAHADHILVKFTDLKYQLYNGVLNHVDEHVAEEVAVPQEIQELHHVFKVVYNQEGRAVGIVTEANEHEWSRNVKRAIASILQLHVDSVKPDTHHGVAHSFVTKEHSVYGPGVVHYDVFHDHQDQNVIVVHKLLETHPHRLFNHVFSSSHIKKCGSVPGKSTGVHDGITHFESIYGSHEDHPVNYDAQRKYHIVHENGHHVVHHIEANGGIYHIPLHGKSEAQYVFVNQTFDLVQQGPVKEQYTVKSEHVEHHLTQHLFGDHVGTDDQHHEKHHATHDVTEGRRVVDVQKHLPHVHEDFETVYEYLHHDHIHGGVPDYKKGQVIYRLHRYLSHFDYNTLLQLHTSIKTKHAEHHEQILHVYHQLLPLVGTKDAVLVVKHLIKNNLIVPHVAIKVLHNLGHHVKVPTRELVHELEEFLHLPESIDWQVRKAAILAFGGVVHHAHKFEKVSKFNHQVEHSDNIEFDPHHHEHGQVHEHEHVFYEYNHDFHVDSEIDKHYEKYVVDIVNKLKTTEHHDHFIAYVGALYNMRLFVVYKHLVPAVHGEWWQDHHKRLLVLHAIFPSIKHNAEAVTHTYWPIFVNHHEHTELRIFAYHYIMQSDVAEHKMKNIFWYMQNEPHHEVYHFYYTHLYHLAHSAVHCHEHIHHHAAQLLRYLAPPHYGVSHYHISDYRDAVYDYGIGVHGAFVNSNTSYIFHGAVKYYFNQAHEDFHVFVKVHGIEKLGHVFKLNTQPNHQGSFNYKELFKYLTAVKEHPDIHLEVLVAKHGQIYHTLYVDHSNIGDVHHFVDIIWGKNNVEHIDVHYETYTQVHLPTDIGFPASWLIFVPEVHKRDVHHTQDGTNNVANLHYNSHFQTWSHSRVGLDFYNPILDIFQGIHKVYTYDSATPFYGDVTFNWEQKIVKFTHKVHDVAEKNVWGLRSHVGSFVYVDDLFHEHDVLKHGKRYVPVVWGEGVHSNYIQEHHPHTHNYTLWDEEDLNTGSHWEVVVYNTDHHISNGSFHHALHLFEQPHTKHFSTPFQHFLLTYLNWHQYVRNQPQPGHHGIVIRSVPSQVHHVSHIDLTFRVHSAQVEGPIADIFAPAYKHNIRVTYAVKGGEKALKTWDFNVDVNQNAGHTVNAVKVQATRIVPGQKHFVVCAEATKKYSHEGVTGHFNLATSHSDDGHCAADDTIVDVTVTGTKSEGQVEHHHPYGACQYPVPYKGGVHHFHTVECLLAHTSVRKYVYNIKVKDVQEEYKHYFYWVWDVIKSDHFQYYDVNHEHDVHVEEHTSRVEVHYPLDGHHVDVHIYTPQHHYSFTGVPTHHLHHFGFQPDTTVYSSSFVHLHKLGLVQHCEINNASLIHHDYHGVHQEHHTVPHEWHLYAADVAASPKYAVYVKEVEHHKFAVKIVAQSHVLEIHPQGHHDVHKITVDGQQVDSHKVHYVQDWVTYHVLDDEVTYPVVVYLPHAGIHVEYDHFNHVQVSVPYVDHDWHGHCFSHQHHH